MFIRQRVRFGPASGMGGAHHSRTLLNQTHGRYKSIADLDQRDFCKCHLLQSPAHAFSPHEAHWTFTYKAEGSHSFRASLWKMTAPQIPAPWKWGLESGVWHQVKNKSRKGSAKAKQLSLGLRHTRPFSSLDFHFSLLTLTSEDK